MALGGVCSLGVGWCVFGLGFVRTRALSHTHLHTYTRANMPHWDLGGAAGCVVGCELSLGVWLVFVPSACLYVRMAGSNRLRMLQPT